MRTRGVKSVSMGMVVSMVCEYEYSVWYGLIVKTNHIITQKTKPY